MKFIATFSLVSCLVSAAAHAAVSTTCTSSQASPIITTPAVLAPVYSTAHVAPVATTTPCTTVAPVVVTTTPPCTTTTTKAAPIITTAPVEVYKTVAPVATTTPCTTVAPVVATPGTGLYNAYPDAPVPTEQVAPIATDYAVYQSSANTVDVQSLSSISFVIAMIVASL